MARQRIPRAVADAAGPALDALAYTLQGLLYAATTTQALAHDFTDVLDEIQPAVEPAPIDAPPAAATPTAPPAEVRVRFPAGALAVEAPVSITRLHENTTVQLEFAREEQPAEPGIAAYAVEDRSEETPTNVADASVPRGSTHHDTQGEGAA